MIPREYQEKESNKILKILRKYSLAYIAWEERTGKSLTAILTVEKSKARHCLIITKANAVKGWQKTILEYRPNKQFDVVTYGKVKDYDGNPDIVILDEAHNYISGYPKPSSTWLNVYKKVYGLPIIYISATPYSQGYMLLYHQFKLSKWSPFKLYSNFYAWFKEFGVPYTIKINGKEVNQYKSMQNERIANMVNHLFSIKTRKELGFEYEPEDRVCKINLTEDTKQLYNTLIKHKVLTVNDFTILADTKIKLRSALHMIEGGTIKFTSPHKLKHTNNILLETKERVASKLLYHYYIDLGNREKIDWIKKKFGDSSDIVIMYNYKGEKILLENNFANATILQATSYAEGIDLYDKKHLIIYSQDFSTARHTQRRARQASKSRQEDIIVYFPIVPNAVSDQVYKTVSVNKQNFIDSLFERIEL